MCTLLVGTKVLEILYLHAEKFKVLKPVTWSPSYVATLPMVGPGGYRGVIGLCTPGHKSPK